MTSYINYGLAVSHFLHGQTDKRTNLKQWLLLSDKYVIITTTEAVMFYQAFDCLSVF